MNQLGLGALLYVEWWDHAGNTSWSTAAEIGTEPMLCRSVGWLFDESKTALTLVPHQAETPEFSALGQGTITIYKPCLVRRVRLRDPSKGGKR